MLKIGIIGVGHMGKTLTRKLSSIGHEVKVANSRGPETIDGDVLSAGARAVTAPQAAADVDVVILSVPLSRVPQIAPVIARASSSAVIIDTSNYYPARDLSIEAIENGQVESLWVAEQLGRSVVKAWNAIGSDSFAEKGAPAGSPDRIAVPVAADTPHQREIAMRLVDETGFDGVDAGTLAESWRQQPGTPAYCTDLTRAEMPEALATADAERAPKRRDIAFAAVVERTGGGGANPDGTYLVRLNRALNM